MITRRMVTRTGIVLAIAALAVGGWPVEGSAQEPRVPHIVVSVGSRWWTYNQEQLKAMATKAHPNTRGTHTNPAIPLDQLLAKDARVPLERIKQVVIVAQQRVLLLEGADLQHLPRLLIVLGRQYSHLAPETEDAHQALRPVLGKPRLEDIERIEVTLAR